MYMFNYSLDNDGPHWWQISITFFFKNFDPKIVLCYMCYMCKNKWPTISFVFLANGIRVPANALILNKHIKYYRKIFNLALPKIKLDTVKYLSYFMHLFNCKVRALLLTWGRRLFRDFIKKIDLVKNRLSFCS